MVDKIIEGISRFQNDVYPDQQKLFQDLATTQSPDVLFITCSDSRIDPNLITQTNPGDLFICRNAGNIVPPNSNITGGTTASIEYAVAALGVRHIVICGHTDCGAMKGALNPAALSELPHVSAWLSHSAAACRTVQENYGDLKDDDKLQKLIEENVLAQMQHIRTHPYVASRMHAGKVELHGWVYDIKSGGFKVYNAKSGKFEEMLMEQERQSLTSRKKA
jgi:carbonic anhydrase